MHQDGKREEISGGGLSRVQEELRAILGPLETSEHEQPMVTLVGYELFAGAYNGVRRRLRTILWRDGKDNGRKQEWPGGGNGFEPGYFNESIEGALGEIAVAKYLNCYWDSSVDTWKEPDLAGLIQVRTRTQHHWDLIVRHKDADHEVYVLATGRAPSYILRGWIRGADAKQPQYLKNHGSYHPAFFVPQKDLQPMATLKEMIR